MKKNDLKKQSSTLIICMSCILVLMLMCYFGINNSKGTYSSLVCPDGMYDTGEGCCPDGVGNTNYGMHCETVAEEYESNGWYYSNQIDMGCYVLKPSGQCPTGTTQKNYAGPEDGVDQYYCVANDKYQCLLPASEKVEVTEPETATCEHKVASDKLPEGFTYTSALTELQYDHEYVGRGCMVTLLLDKDASFYDNETTVQNHLSNICDYAYESSTLGSILARGWYCYIKKDSGSTGNTDTDGYCYMEKETGKISWSTTSLFNTYYKNITSTYSTESSCLANSVTNSNNGCTYKKIDDDSYYTGTNSSCCPSTGASYDSVNNICTVKELTFSNGGGTYYYWPFDSCSSGYSKNENSLNFCLKCNSGYVATGANCIASSGSGTTEPTLTVSKTSLTISNGKSDTFTVSANVVGDFKIESNSTKIATVSPSTISSVSANVQKTVTVNGVSVGGPMTVIITFTPDDTTNYSKVTKTVSVNVVDDSEPETTYTVKFGALTDDYLQDPVLLKNGNVVTNHTVSGLTSSSFNLSNYSASSDNYEFLHWSYGDCDNALPNTLTLTQATTNIYACWRASNKKTYTATFNSNGGILSGVSTLSCTTSTSTSCSVTNLPIAVRSDYTFVGWGTAANCSSGNTSSLSLSADTTYYACWKKNTEPSVYYTVNYKLDGGKFPNGDSSRTVILSSTELLEKPGVNPIKDGHKFVGWYNGNNKFNGFDSFVTSDLTLVAHYEKLAEDKCKYTCNSGDIYDASIGKCVSIDVGGKKIGIITNSYVVKLECTNSLYTAGEIVQPQNDSYYCKTGYTKEGWVSADNCKFGSACTSASGTCTKEWQGLCYKTYNVTKNCPTGNGNVTENPKTGSVAIFIAWIVGFVAIVYSIWYFRKARVQ